MPRQHESRKGDIKRAADTTGVLCQTHIGGQALIEGVMMRGRYSWAAAIRTPDGTIYTEEHDLAARPDKHSWLNWPIIRGCRAMVESLVLGFKALEVASENAFDFSEDEDDAAPGEDVVADAPVANAAAGVHVEADNITASGLPSQPAVADKRDSSPVSAALRGGAAASPALDTITTSHSGPAANAPKDESKESRGIMIVGGVIGVVLGVAAFIMLPAFLSNLVVGDYNSNIIAWNIFDGVVRVAIFIVYIWLISLMKDIKRMFRYHGAEHKTIHCFEHGLELTPQNAAQFTTLHVRCGTAFLITTLILAIIVFSMVPVREITMALGVVDSTWQFVIIVLTRIIFIPLVAGLSYEVTVRWAGAHPERKSVRVVLWPGLQMQKLTTAEPDEQMLECAIAAMKLVLAREEREAAKLAAEQQDQPQAVGSA